MCISTHFLQKHRRGLWFACIWAIVSLFTIAFLISFVHPSLHTQTTNPNHKYNTDTKQSITQPLRSSLSKGLKSNHSSEIQWIDALQSKYHNKTVYCAWDTFNYLPSITEQLHNTYKNGKFNGNGISTEYINKQRYLKSTIPKQYLRLKAIHGTLYLSNHLPSGLSYRFAWWLYYFMRLFEKYGAFIPDTDFIIFMGDSGNIQFDYTVFPFFVGDAVEIENKRNHTSQLPLFTMPRSYIWLHQSPVEGYSDVLCYRDSDGFNDFDQKKNAAIFRGGASGGFWRTSKRGKVIVPSTDDNIAEIDAKYSCWRNGHQISSGIPRKYCAPFTNTTYQMRYKYVILIDGNSVRDAFPKQLGIGSLLLKQKSRFKEFWYYNLIDKQHMIEWEDMDELQSTVANLVSMKVDITKQKEIAQNGRAFVDEYLTDECMDCFVIHMIQLYNHYFFNQDTVELAPYDKAINKQSIKALLKKGYREHIYGFEYHCATNNQTIVSQKI